MATDKTRESDEQSDEGSGPNTGRSYLLISYVLFYLSYK